MSAATRRMGLGLLCCARKVSGHAVADPTIALTRSRRRIAFTKAGTTPNGAHYSRDLRPTKWGSGVSLHSSNLKSPMSALGQKQTSQCVCAMSALPPKADIGTQSRNVRFVPIADSCTAAIWIDAERNQFLGLGVKCLRRQRSLRNPRKCLHDVRRAAAQITQMRAQYLRGLRPIVVHGYLQLLVSSEECHFPKRPKRDALELCAKSGHSPHSINSSARASTCGGTVRPSSFAALRLITSSNLVGCSTGRSAGLAPLSILSTYSAVRRQMAVKLGP